LLSSQPLMSNDINLVRLRPKASVFSLGFICTSEAEQSAHCSQSQTLRSTSAKGINSL